MDTNETQAPFVERKVVRRGLIAGLAGLGAAALVKLSGAAKPLPAEAAQAALLFPNASADPATTNIAWNTTLLQAGATPGGVILLHVDASTATVGSHAGIHAYGGGSNGAGVDARGSAGTGTGYGVVAQGGLGVGGGSNSGSPGVYSVGGYSGSGTAGDGVSAVGGTTAGGKFGRGVSGLSNNNKGVYGQSTSSDGVHGHSTSGVGLRGTSANFVGLVGISDNSIGLYGYNAAVNTPAFYAENLAPSGRIAALYNGDVRVQGNFTVLPGFAKNAAVAMPDGSEAVLYCQESPEAYFEDFGRARLVNGVAHVQIEAEFASIVRRDDYMVFITPGGDASLYVSRQDANGFEVKETRNGTSSVPFAYRIVAKRKDIEGKRLARLDPGLKQNLAKLRGESAAKMPGGVQRGVESPLVPHEPLEPITLPEPPRRP
jgi:hypothetical protein